MTGMRTDRYGLYGDLPSPHDGLQLWINKGKAYGGSRVDERRRREEVVRGKRKAGTLRDLWPEGELDSASDRGRGLRSTSANGRE